MKVGGSFHHQRHPRWPKVNFYDQNHYFHSVFKKRKNKTFSVARKWKLKKTRIAWKMGRRQFFQISTSQVACSTPSVYLEEMVCLKTFAFTGVERAWWDNKYHRSKKTQCSDSPKSPFSSHQSAQFMTFFWPVKIFPLWKLGPERRDSDNNRGPTDAPQTRWYHLHVLHFSPSPHLLVFGNGFNLDDLDCHLFHEVQEANLNQYEERYIENNQWWS